MLKKMIIHGLVAAALIGAAAAVYAEGRESGYLAPETASTPSSEKDARPMQGNGYLPDSSQRKDGHKSYFRDRAQESHEDHEGSEHRRKHGHRDDDD